MLQRYIYNGDGLGYNANCSVFTCTSSNLNLLFHYDFKQLILFWEERSESKRRKEIYIYFPFS